jgi:hypothetical protein
MSHIKNSLAYFERLYCSSSKAVVKRHVTEYVVDKLHGMTNIVGPGGDNIASLLA